MKRKLEIEKKKIRKKCASRIHYPSYVQKYEEIKMNLTLDTSSQCDQS